MSDLSRQVFDPEDFLTRAGIDRSILECRKNKEIFAQGDPADSVFYLQKGRVKLTVVSGHGKEAVVAILQPKQFFGEACLNGQARRAATTTALEDCVVTSITKGAMLAELGREPKLSELFTAYLLSRNNRIEQDLIDQLFNSSEKRLARQLLLLANVSQAGDRQQVIAEISQETLAEMIGTTRSRVSFFMNKFRKLGLISYDKNIEVHNALLDAVLRDRSRIVGDDFFNGA
jgi:CRP/FNR family cyclic AMP-dependent transcriptional regulator